MGYSASIMTHAFWFFETKTTAEYLLEGLTKKELLELSLNENIYQVDSERRAREVVNVCWRRLEGFSDELLDYLTKCDQHSAKLLVFISILTDDQLYFEFMYEVFRQHIILGNYTIKNSDLDIFFRNKSNQSEIIENWIDTTLKRVKANYKQFLIESGLLERDDDEYKIILPFIDFRLKELLIQNNFAPYLDTITGGF